MRCYMFIYFLMVCISQHVRPELDSSLLGRTNLMLCQVSLLSLSVSWNFCLELHVVITTLLVIKC